MSVIRQSKHHYPTGILFVLISSLSVACGMLLVKGATEHVSISMMIWLRCLIPFLILLIIHGARFQLPKLHFNHWPWYVLRITGFLGSNVLIFYYFSKGNIVDGTVLFMTSQMFVPILNRFVFGVQHHWRFYLALVLAFAGVVIAVKPDGAMIDPFMLIGLAAGLTNALSQVALHRLSQVEEVKSIIFSSFLIGSVVTTLWVLGEMIFEPHFFAGQLSWHATWIMLAWMGAYSVISIFNQSLRAKAYTYVRKAASLGPWTYTTIIFSAILGLIFFQHVPGWQALIGFVLIACSAVLTLLFRSK